MVAAKLDQSRVLVTKFHQNRLTLKGRSADQRHADRQTDRQTQLKIMALQVCNRANRQTDRQTDRHKPFEEDEVEVVVVLGQHVADDACRVTIADLIAGQEEVDTLGEVPQLGRHVVSERPRHKYTSRVSTVCCSTLLLFFLREITTTTTVLCLVLRDHLGEPVPEENFWTLWCKGRLTEADIPNIRLGATPSRLTCAHLHHPPYFFTGWMPFLPPNQQRQSTEGKKIN